ncbi:MAG: hypothetical protein V3R70_03195, partial [Syntrophobacteria bacterium]
SNTPMHLTPQKSPLPLETMSQFTEPVIPDERRFAGEIRNPENYNDVIWSLVPRLRGDVVWIPARVRRRRTWPG